MKLDRISLGDERAGYSPLVSRCVRPSKGRSQHPYRDSSRRSCERSSYPPRPVSWFLLATFQLQFAGASQRVETLETEKSDHHRNAECNRGHTNRDLTAGPSVENCSPCPLIAPQPT